MPDRSGHGGLAVLAAALGYFVDAYDLILHVAPALPTCRRAILDYS